MSEQAKKVQLNGRTRRGFRLMLKQGLRENVLQFVKNFSGDEVPRKDRLTKYEQLEIQQALHWVEQEVGKLSEETDEEPVGDTGPDGAERREADPAPVPPAVG